VDQGKPGDTGPGHSISLKARLHDGMCWRKSSTN
jgi:hypothetical protein